jgi:hypothetical protein
MRITTLLSTAALAMIVASPALAQPPAGGGGRGMLPTYEAMDANKDGKVTKEELTASLPEQAKQFADRIFESRDTNKDGAITKEENDAAPAMGRGRGGGAPPAQ